jgi:uncharacterized membrane protein YedE/YeeE
MTTLSAESLAAPRPLSDETPPHRSIAGAVVLAGIFMSVAWLLGLIAEQGTRLQLSFVLGGAFGYVLQRSRFCFLCMWRDYLDHGDPRGVVGILTALAVGAAGYTLIFGAWLPDPSGLRLPPTAHIGPVGPVLVVAGLAFGAGMAISGSCISAHLYRLAEGSPTAPFALIGAVFGFWLGFASWNTLYLASLSEAPVIWLPRHLGYGGTLVATIVLLGGLSAWLLRVGPFRPSGGVAQEEPHPLTAIFVARWPAWVGGLLVGVIGVAAYLRLSPLGVTAEIGSRARQAADAFGLLPDRLEGLDAFRGCATLVRDAILTPNGTFVLGLVLAAGVASAGAGAFKPAWPRLGQILRGLAGGTLLGWGAMLGLGCTVGTLLSGISAGAVSGWIFALAVIVGTTVSLRAARWFG